MRGDVTKVTDSQIKITRFFEEYDQFNLKKIDFIFKSILERARNEALLEIKQSGRLPKKIATSLQKMEEIYSSYQSLVQHFGTERDMERLEIGQDMLPAYGEFAKALRKLRGEKPWRQFGDAKIVPFIDTIPDFLKFLANFPVFSGMHTLGQVLVFLIMRLSRKHWPEHKKNSLK